MGPCPAKIDRPRLLANNNDNNDNNDNNNNDNNDNNDNNVQF